jgi:glycine/D-amino acid oxidase-like deaminating enzyme
MELDYDVVIIGGAFSGAATALMIKRKHPGRARAHYREECRVRSQSRRIDHGSEQLLQNWARVLEEVVSCYWPQWFAFAPLS